MFACVTAYVLSVLSLCTVFGSHFHSASLSTYRWSLSQPHLVFAYANEALDNSKTSRQKYSECEALCRSNPQTIAVAAAQLCHYQRECHRETADFESWRELTAPSSRLHFRGDRWSRFFEYCRVQQSTTQLLQYNKCASISAIVLNVLISKILEKRPHLLKDAWIIYETMSKLIPPDAFAS